MAPDRAQPGNAATLRIRHRDYLEAAGQAGLTADQAQALWTALRVRPAPSSRFDLPQLAWYAGSLIVLGAMLLLLDLVWNEFGDWALVGLSSLYAIGFWIAGDRQGRNHPERSVGGLLVAVAICIFGVAIAALQRALGFLAEDWPHDGLDLLNNLALGPFPSTAIATAAALLALFAYRQTVLVALTSFGTWLALLILAEAAAQPHGLDWEELMRFCIVTGLVQLAIAWTVDGRGERDYAFWLYGLGLLSFWGGLTGLGSDSELAKAGYAAINILLLLAAVWLQRRVFALAGGLGLAFYIGDLTYRVFADSILFPFVLSLIGIGLIVGGLRYYRRRAAIDAWAEARLPRFLKALRPARLGGDDRD